MPTGFGDFPRRCDLGTVVAVRVASGEPPPNWSRKTFFQEKFGEFGDVVQIEIQPGHGVAYVEFSDKRDAEDAVKEMAGAQLGGRQIIVEIANARREIGKKSEGEEHIAELSRTFSLDENATAGLKRAFHERARLGRDLEKDFAELADHLSACKKPSAFVCLKLADLRSGKELGPCKFAPAARSASGGPATARVAEESPDTGQAVPLSRRDADVQRSSNRSRSRIDADVQRSVNRSRSRRRRGAQDCTDRHDGDHVQRQDHSRSRQRRSRSRGHRQSSRRRGRSSSRSRAPKQDGK